MTLNHSLLCSNRLQLGLSAISAIILTRSLRPLSAARRISSPISRFMSNTGALKQTNGQHQFGWAISDKIQPEVVPGKIDVWSAFSPLAGHVPKDALNLGQGELPAILTLLSL